jgi:hypothetical protein
MISVAAVSTSGTAYTGRADGLFSTNDQAKLKQAGAWPTAITAPTAPTITSGTAGDSSATILFTPPSQLNGETIIGYRATTDPGNIIADSTSSPLTITGLTNNVTYSITLATNSNSGLGPQSTSISLMPVPPPPGAPTIRSSAVMTTGFVFRSVNVYFTPPVPVPNHPTTDYEIYVTNTSTNITTLGATVSAATVDASVKDGSGNSFASCAGLSGSTTYKFSVKARNSAGAGAASGFTSDITTGLASPAYYGQPFGGGYFAGYTYNTDTWVQQFLIIEPMAGYGTTSYASSWQNESLYNLMTTTDMWDGYKNTIRMNGYNTGTFTTASPAADWARTRTTNGYNDWYIPSYNEASYFVNLLFANSPWVTGGSESFSYYNYWTSYEKPTITPPHNSYTMAYIIGFNLNAGSYAVGFSYTFKSYNYSLRLTRRTPYYTN